MRFMVRFGIEIGYMHAEQSHVTIHIKWQLTLVLAKVDYQQEQEQKQHSLRLYHVLLIYLFFWFTHFSPLSLSLSFHFCLPSSLWSHLACIHSTDFSHRPFHLKVKIPNELCVCDHDDGQQPGQQLQAKCIAVYGYGRIAYRLCFVAHSTRTFSDGH